MSSTNPKRTITVDDEPRLAAVVIRAIEMVNNKRFTMQYVVSQQMQKMYPDAIKDGIDKLNAAMDKAIWALPNNEAYLRGYWYGYFKSISSSDSRWRFHPSYVLGREDAEADKAAGLEASASHTLRAAEEYRDGSSFWIKTNHNSVVPVGSIFQSFSTIPPPGSMPCDGRSLKVSDYPDLHAVLGTTYGGDTTTGTFQVPDLRSTL